MSADSISAYLNEIGRHRLLTADEEITLSRQVQRWLELKDLDRPLTPRERREVRLGERAKERMIVHNLRLVVNVAKKYIKLLRHGGLSFEDLIQEGTIGLDRAVELFDATKGYKFSTYSYWWIRQGITRAIYTKDRCIRVPQHMLEKLQKSLNFKRDFMVENGYEPSIAELAESVEMTAKDYATLVSRTNTHKSLDELASVDGSPLLDLVPDESESNQILEEVDKSVTYEQLNLAFFRLKDCERDIVSSIYGLKDGIAVSRKEMGLRRGVTREAIRQREMRGLMKLRLELTEKVEDRVAA